MAKQAGEDPLVAAAFDKDRHAELARAVEQLTPDEAQFFLDKLERALRRRRLQLIGYLVAMLAWAAGMVVVGTLYAMSSDGHFVNWMFLLPFALVGAILYAFGRWAERVGGGAKLPPPRSAPQAGSETGVDSKP